jgi:hypothetical protein
MFALAVSSASSVLEHQRILWMENKRREPSFWAAHHVKPGHRRQLVLHTYTQVTGRSARLPLMQDHSSVRAMPIFPRDRHHLRPMRMPGDIADGDAVS